MEDEIKYTLRQPCVGFGSNVFVGEWFGTEAMPAVKHAAHFL